ncbi:hypothetical protein M0804_008153 [Polistes exclamans]|nr:hypothetical protein M0804_008153 [Polistes exclamans]
MFTNLVEIMIVAYRTSIYDDDDDDNDDYGKNGLKDLGGFRKRGRREPNITTQFNRPVKRNSLKSFRRNTK